MAYASASDVAAFCANLTQGAANFSDATTPTYTQVNVWLTSGCAIIESSLESKGYAAPTNANSALYRELGQLNAYYGAAMAELARTNVRLSPGERTRGQVFEKMFWDGLQKVLDRDLSLAGLTAVAAGGGYVGGISLSDKAAVEANTDRVPARFTRGIFRDPTGGVPGDTSDAESG